MVRAAGRAAGAGTCGGSEWLGRSESGRCARGVPGRVDRHVVLEDVHRVLGLLVRLGAHRAFDHHVRDAVADGGRHPRVALLDPRGELDVRLLVGVVVGGARERLGDHELRHVDLVLQQVGDLHLDVPVAEGGERGERWGARGEGLQPCERPCPRRVPYAIAVSTSLLMRIARRLVSTMSRVSAQLSRRAVSIPFMSM